MGWAEALLPYRASDDPLGFLGAALLAQDQTLFRLAATWPRVKRVLPPPPKPGEEIDLEEVWSKTDDSGHGLLLAGQDDQRPEDAPRLHSIKPESGTRPWALQGAWSV